jgi:putative phosphoribosyl transferase
MSGVMRRPRGWWRPGSSVQGAGRSPDMFDDRVDAGRRLAAELLRVEPGLLDEDVVVLGLPRGGVPVAAEVAAVLHAPLDVVVVRKLGVPWQPEVAMGALGEGGVELLDSRVVRSLGITPDDVELVRRRELDALDARVATLRAGRAPLDLVGRTAVVVDDGLATGSTARAACGVVMHRGAARVLLAAPVGPASTVATFPDADRVVCVLTPTDFTAVGQFYRDFTPTTDDEVVAILARSHDPRDRRSRRT